MAGFRCPKCDAEMEMQEDEKNPEQDYWECPRCGFRCLVNESE